MVIDMLDSPPSGSVTPAGCDAVPVPHSLSIVVPRIGAVLRHAMPNVIEGKLVPLALFVGFLELVGTMSALLVALAWSLGATLYRYATRRKVSGLLVLGSVALTARTIAALLTGSMLVYFLQPTISTALVGLAFMISVPLGSPLAQRLADDVFPFDAETKAHPLVRQFFVRLSLLWSVTSLVNAAITVWLLLTQSTTTFVVVKSFLGPVTTSVTLVGGLLWFRMTLSRQGARLVYATVPSA
jgi:intracellular septation protein A